MLSTGQLLQDRYEIQGILGKGGMGAVYRAFDNRLNVVCVVKEMLLTPEALANATDAAQQFKREAGMLALLRHPNLPRVGDYFIDQGSYYLVMDFIEGQDLRHLISADGLAEPTVLHYAAQLLDVLEYIHGEGVVHRDIKPANIIVQSNGRVVLVDFGLAKMQSAGSGLTMTYLRGAGTPEYAPLEQLKGGTDQRSDVYSLGATLYQALTGRSPLDATDRAIGKAMPTIRELKPGVSAQTEHVIQRAMMLNRDLRYPTAAAMRVDLMKGVKPRATAPPRVAPVTQEKTPVAVKPALASTAVIAAPDQQRKRWMQIGVGAGAAVVLLVAALALKGALDSNASAGVIGAPTPTHNVVVTSRALRPTLRATGTSIATQQAPSVSDTALPTAVKIAATTTLYPSVTALASETPTSVSTETPTPPATNTPAPTKATPLPSATPGNPGMLYSAPVLASPASGTVFSAIDKPSLSWSSSKALGPADYYLVEIGHSKGVDPYYEKGTSVIPRDYLPGLAVDGRLTWRVLVVRKAGDTYTVVSPPSATWEFIWKAANQGGSPGQPGSPPTLAPP